jgi:hypothetical protein
MHASPLLWPVVVLVAWSLIMMVWMAAVRFRAFRSAGISLKGRRGGRGQNLEGVLPDSANWPAHNYAHLMEQPTIFYAIVFALILMGFDAWINVWLAWGYVVLRIVHSLVQATVNVVPVRFTIFLLSSLCLISLTVHAALRLMHG